MELRESYARSEEENSDDSCMYDEENDMEGFEEKMLEYELFGLR
jgi:hypothetical protein